MCGIAGFWQQSGAGQAEMSSQARAMACVMAHRGPDDDGIWIDARVGVAFAFRRLAILDLSPAGHQPMRSQSGRYVIAFNEHGFRGHSDTEVILAAVEAWGLHAAVGRFVGMFAFSLWDRQERKLTLVRDRLGIKPLYYGWTGRAIVWGSELKALRAHPSFCEEIDRDALSLFLRHSGVPSPYSIYKNVRKLPPGAILTISAPEAEEVRRQPLIYWSANRVVEEAMRDEFAGSEAEAADQLDRLLREAVRLRMIADVPLGAFLSGGVDSSTVVALMQSQSDRPIKTFSIGFEEGEYDEAPQAREVASFLGTDHRELYVTANEAREVIPLLPQMFDEPFSDASQIPTYLVSRLAREHVAVSLSGDGGDELFSGYTRCLTTRAIWRAQKWLPISLRRGLGSLLPGMRGEVWRDILGMPSAEALYYRMVSHWKRPGEVVVGGCEPPTALSRLSERPGALDLPRHMMLADLVSYLPDDILTKVDRASMAVSLEARVPLLDHRVVEFAARLPASMKIRGGQGKWILRQVLARYVPPRLTERPKMGFGVPIGSWLRGPLREWAEALLSESRLRSEGYFHPSPVRKIWSEHLSGGRDWQYYLWDILMFQAWLETRKPSIINRREHQPSLCVESTEN
jgi:asparagine synthase (glutamine-hydrolysing)